MKLQILVFLVLTISFTEASNKEASFFPDDFFIGGTLPEVEVVHKVPSRTDVYLLARLLNAECGGEPYRGKLAVANVVVNRMKRRNKSLRQVIYRPRQFDGIKSRRFYAVPTQDCIQAATEILGGRRILPESVVYFHNREISTDIEHVANVEKNIYLTIGNHTFCHDPRLIKQITIP